MDTVTEIDSGKRPFAVYCTRRENPGTTQPARKQCGFFATRDGNVKFIRDSLEKTL